jgi:hypothetical protein
MGVTHTHARTVSRWCSVAWGPRGAGPLRHRPCGRGSRTRTFGSTSMDTARRVARINLRQPAAPARRAAVGRTLQASPPSTRTGARLRRTNGTTARAHPHRSPSPCRRRTSHGTPNQPRARVHTHAQESHGKLSAHGGGAGCILTSQMGTLRMGCCTISQRSSPQMVHVHLPGDGVLKSA